jgi:hypothetical protein
MVVLPYLFPNQSYDENQLVPKKILLIKPITSVNIPTVWTHPFTQTENNAK